MIPEPNVKTLDVTPLPREGRPIRTFRSCDLLNPEWQSLKVERLQAEMF